MDAQDFFLPTRPTTHTGSFSVVSGVLRISDPIYDIDCPFAGIVRAKSGKWTWSVVVNNLEAVITAKFVDAVFDGEQWERKPFQVGVDSGRFGIYDAAEYSEDNFKFMDHESKVIDLGYGVVSCTGIGDGTFDCETIDQDGIAVAVRLASRW